MTDVLGSTLTRNRRTSWMVLLLVAVLVMGRWTRLPETQLSLLWPAAGVAVWWFLGSRDRARWVVDASLLVLVVLAVNALTGAPLLVATGFGLINLVHAVVGATLLNRWQLSHRNPWRTADPALLLAASTAAGFVSGLLSAVVASALLDSAFLSSFLLLAVRNTTGTFLVLLVVLVVVRPRRLQECVRGERMREWVSAAVVGLVAYLGLFAWQPGLPLAFLVLPVAVWAGSRLGLARATVLSVGLGALAVALTIAGLGPFAPVDPTTTRAAVVQGFLLVTVLTTTSLAAMQEDRARIADALTSTRRSLAASIDAALIGTCVVVDDDGCVGRMARPNPALRRLLRTDEPPTGAACTRTSAAGAGACWLAYLQPDDAAAVRAVLAEIAEGTRAEWTGELGHRLCDESVVWAQVHLSRLPEDVTGLEGDEPAASGSSFAARAGHAAVAQFLDITARKDAEAQLMHLALHDELTGLPNRVLLRDRIELALGIARRSRTHVALVFLDLDHFKSINDSLGHDAGDVVLEAVAQRLRLALRPNDTVARIGGDEFVACCPDVGSRAEADELARRLVAAVSQPVRVDDRFVPVGVSAGLTLSRQGDSASTLLKQSDAAMYAAKRSGRGRVESFAQDLEVQASRHLTLSAELREALDQEQFTLHYQPIVDIATGAVTACEALVRWNHPTRGLLAPGQWLDVAEESDLIVELGEWVLRRAAHDMARIAEKVRPLKVHVNVSGRQLARAGLVDEVASALADSSLPAHLVVLELTETHLLEVHNSLLTDFSRLHALGVEIAVDDFGTGFSSLTQLVRLPVDSVKIDRSFVAGADDDPRSCAVVRGVLGMAEALGLHAVAEGVETPAQAARLQSMGCLSGQGYLWSPPVALGAFEELLMTSSVLAAGAPAPRAELVRSVDAPATDRV